MSRRLASQLRSRTARAIGGVFVVRGAGQALLFLTHLLLARLLGPSEYGVVAYATAWLAIFGPLSTLGQHNASMRFVAAYLANAQWPELRGYLSWTVRAGWIVSSAIALAGAAIAFALREHIAAEQFPALVIAILGVPLYAQVLLGQGTLRGLHRAVAGEMLERVLRPLLWLGFSLAAYVLFSASFDGSGAVLALVASCAVSLLGVRIVLKQSVRPELAAARPRQESGQWIKTGIALMFIASMQLVLNRLDVLMLGTLADTRSVGIYFAAGRIAELAAFGLQCANAIVAPRISALHASGQRAALKRLLTLAARGVAAFTLLVCVVLGFAGEWALSWFGEGFAAGHPALLCLLAAYAVNALCGPVGYLAIMTGHERWMALNQLVAALLNVVLNLLLIPRYGILGAAAATATTMVLWNLALLCFVGYRLRLNPTVFSRLGPAKPGAA